MTEVEKVYYLRVAWEGETWREVTKEDWIHAERQAGFRPKMSRDDPKYMQVCATGGFYGYGLEGRIQYNHREVIDE